MNAPLPPTTWTTGTTEVFKTGTWRAALPRYEAAPSPCHVACPVGGDIAEWIGLAGAEEWQRAWTTLTRNNPFPAVTGRVCHHPCEAACNRGGWDAPVSVCALERFVGDKALAEGWRYPQVPLTRKERIAVVGGGPSGLSAAYQLRLRGYAVTIFEAQPELGGLLRQGIPPYRLPREVLDGEIARILELGIEARVGYSLATAGRFERLRTEFDAVYLAMGASRTKRLPQLDYGASWLLDGAAYLAQSNAGSPPSLGRRLIVIGGGSAAMDVARSARRAGHEVSVLSLERESQMPAQREEIVQAREEGIVLVDGASLREVRAHGQGLELHCEKVLFEPGPTAGEFRITPLAGSGFTLHADAIVPAIGQDPELSAVCPVVETRGALIKTDGGRATSLAGVYAGGDVASNARFVSQAIGMGKEAARQIDCWLQGAAGAAEQASGAVPFSAINTFYHAHVSRTQSERLGAAQRLAGYAEVEGALHAADAVREAGRCFSCGTCIYCDNCFYHCPDMAVRRVAGGYAIAEEYCKGCGLCVRECPTGSIAMAEECK